MKINNLDGKVCLVTGGSRTLGAAIVRQMALEGAQVAINYYQSGTEALNLCRNLEKQGVNAHLIQADVTQVDQVSHLVTETLAHFGRIDILVNTVGPYVDTPFLALETKDFDAILAGNLRSTFLMSQCVGKVMKEQGYGQIINIAASDYKNRSHSVYGLAKNGVIQLTESIALELAPEVCIHAVAPDLIADNEDMSPELVSQATAATPMGRLVTRDEVAKVVCLLCTSPFEMATGQTIILDGGRTIPRIANGAVDPEDK